jgi:hypothetical protein
VRTSLRTEGDVEKGCEAGGGIRCEAEGRM